MPRGKRSNMPQPSGATPPSEGVELELLQNRLVSAAGGHSSNIFAAQSEMLAEDFFFTVNKKALRRIIDGEFVYDNDGVFVPAAACAEDTPTYRLATLEGLPPEYLVVLQTNGNSDYLEIGYAHKKDGSYEYVGKEPPAQSDPTWRQGPYKRPPVYLDIAPGATGGIGGRQPPLHPTVTTRTDAFFANRTPQQDGDVHGVHATVETEFPGAVQTRVPRAALPPGTSDYAFAHLQDMGRVTEIEEVSNNDYAHAAHGLAIPYATSATGPDAYVPFNPAVPGPGEYANPMYQPSGGTPTVYVPHNGGGTGVAVGDGDYEDIEPFRAMVQGLYDPNNNSAGDRSFVEALEAESALEATQGSSRRKWMIALGLLLLVGTVAGVGVAMSRPGSGGSGNKTAGPGGSPAPGPTPTPTPGPTPNLIPTGAPTLMPVLAPTPNPTEAPSLMSTAFPTPQPSNAPSAAPTIVPTANGGVTTIMPPTPVPSHAPSHAPSVAPSTIIITSTATPTTVTTTSVTTLAPTPVPTRGPTPPPTLPTLPPFVTIAPPTNAPTRTPTRAPTTAPPTFPGLPTPPGGGGGGGRRDLSRVAPTLKPGHIHVNVTQEFTHHGKVMAQKIHNIRQEPLNDRLKPVTTEINRAMKVAAYKKMVQHQGQNITTTTSAVEITAQGGA